MMNPVQWLMKHAGPSCVVGGMTCRTWFRTLRENGFRVDLRYWPRAAGVTIGALANSFFSRVEKWRFETSIRDVEVREPIFILGHWRSGTTHLHNLLALDDRFCAPNTFQSFNPWVFLGNERVASLLVGWMFPRRRPMDDVRMGVGEPQEDEFALCVMGAPSPYISFAFPDHWRQYEAFHTLRQADAIDRARWKDTLRYFAQKIMFANDNRQLVLKSPTHTGRIAIIREVFPDAKFVHIHRHPDTVFQSTRHTLERLEPWMQLRRRRTALLDSIIIDRYREMHSAVLVDREALPSVHYVEVGYQHLREDPAVALRQIYAALHLPDFSHVQSRVEEYRRTHAGYQTNAFGPLSRELHGRLRAEWAPFYEAWGYA